MKHSPFLRKQYLIDRRFQLTFAAYNLVTALVLGGLFYLTLRYSLWQLSEEVAVAGDAPTTLLIERLTSILNRVFFFAGTGTIVALAFFNIFLSHKVAGPLTRFKQHLLKVAAGTESAPLHFRENDFFQDLAETYNACHHDADKKKASPGKSKVA